MRWFEHYKYIKKFTVFVVKLFLLHFFAINTLYRLPPTRGAAFCIGLEAFCAFAAALALGAAAGAAFFVVAFVVFFNSLAALKNDKKNVKRNC